MKVDQETFFITRCALQNKKHGNFASTEFENISTKNGGRT